jgi:regulator of ribonuclease activity A
MGGGLVGGGLGANSMSGGLGMGGGGKGTVTLAESNPASVVALDPTVQLDTYGGSVSFHGQIETIQTMSTELVSQVINQAGQNRVLVIDGGGSRSDGSCLLDGTMAESAIRNGWKGVIVNGYVCDVARLSRTQLGVMALGTTPKKGLVGGGQQSIVISFGSTQFQNGWWVYADVDGVLLSQLDISGGSFGSSSGVGGSSMLTGGGFGGSSSMTGGGGLGGFGGASSSTMGFGGSSSMTGGGGLGGFGGGASSSTMGFGGDGRSMTGAGGLTGGYGSGSRVTGGYSAGGSSFGGGGGGMASRYGTGGSSSYGGGYGGYGSSTSNKKKHKKIFKMLLATSIAAVVWVVCLS